MPLYNDNENLERAELYRLFAHLFMQTPDDELLMHAKELFGMDFNDSIVDIASDFTNLFLGPGTHLPPYESLYNYPVGDSPRMWGKAASDVQYIYAAAGLMLDEEINLVPDHISAELLFMNYLIENNLLIEQQRFFEEHLLEWIPVYCDEIYNHANTVFYKDIAKLLKEFILSDYEEIIK
ncbi:MAG: molecular chaperone TorD family protein [Thermodesulfovibrionales bacterium]|nr:molecular chaperone TorD family protein [Thermodesulfovibrionales bacterium]